MKLMGVKSNCQVLLVPNYRDLRYPPTTPVLMYTTGKGGGIK